MKCAALAVFSALAGLLIRRVNPELSFSLSAATLAVILLGCVTWFGRLQEVIRDTGLIFGDLDMYMRPVLKCLGIALVSKAGADLCRDASQSALAAALEFAGGLCAAASAAPMVMSVMKTIGGML